MPPQTNYWFDLRSCLAMSIRSHVPAHSLHDSSALKAYKWCLQCYCGRCWMQRPIHQTDQSCPWVHFIDPNPTTHQITDPTQPNPWVNPSHGQLCPTSDERPNVLTTYIRPSTPHLHVGVAILQSVSECQWVRWMKHVRYRPMRVGYIMRYYWSPIKRIVRNKAKGKNISRI